MKIKVEVEVPDKDCECCRFQDDDWPRCNLFGKMLNIDLFPISECLQARKEANDKTT